jgi:predicted NUDIX family NTP pyrophosphohydrolase
LTPTRIRRRRRVVSSEELGPSASIGEIRQLGEVRQRGDKHVVAFAGEADFDPASLSSNSFEIEWPPRSGRRQSFPEVDRAEWFDLETARTKLLFGQVELLDALAKLLGDASLPT